MSSDRRRSPRWGPVFADGRPKATGRSRRPAADLLRRSRAAAAGRARAVVVAKPDTPLPPLDCEILIEPTSRLHPLTGLVAALDATAGRAVVALACDMPLVRERLIAWLASSPRRGPTEAGGSFSRCSAATSRRAASASRSARTRATR